MVFDNFKKIRCNHLSFDFANEVWEKNQYWNLRKEIFCKEQQIFEDSDKDLYDENALRIIATCLCMGMHDQVVGVVRIDERQPRIWYGSRLGVAAEYRTLSRFNAYDLFENNEVINPFTISVGASLIFKAVSTANALGCDKFLANVQHQNVSFFERLHWKSLDQIELHGHLHHVMEADLSFYPASAYVHTILKHTA